MYIFIHIYCICVRVYSIYTYRHICVSKYTAFIYIFTHTYIQLKCTDETDGGFTPLQLDFFLLRLKYRVKLFINVRKQRCSIIVTNCSLERRSLFYWYICNAMRWVSLNIYLFNTDSFVLFSQFYNSAPGCCFCSLFALGYNAPDGFLFCYWLKKCTKYFLMICILFMIV